ncbi:MAG: hypothetical protein ACRD9S_08410 [Pyrinomonadaceae bacterium]
MKRTIGFLFALFAAHCSLLPAFAQDLPLTNKFPTELNSLDSLGRTADGPTATLNSTIADDATSFMVTDSAGGFPASGLSLKLDNEIILCTTRSGPIFSGCTRGAKGTTAARHKSGTTVRSPVLSAQRDVLVADLMSIERKVGSGLSTPETNQVFMGTGVGTSGWQSQPSIDCSNCTGIIVGSSEIVAALRYAPMRGSNNLSEITAADLARMNLGLGNIATYNVNSLPAIRATSFSGDGSGLTGMVSRTGGLINSGSITIGADSDSDTDGIIDLQTHATSRVRVLNDGNVQVYKRIGINKAAPRAPIDISVTYPSDTSSGEAMIMFKTPTGHDPFQIYQRTTTFGDDRTDSVGMVFAPEDAPQGTPSFGLLFEDSFGVGAPRFEFHLQTINTAGQADRPLTVNVNRRTGDTNWVTSAAGIFFTTGHLADLTANGVSWTNEELLFDVKNGKWRTRSDSIIFETLNNGGSSSKQIGVFPFPEDNQQSWLVFGTHGKGDNGVSIAMADATSFKFFNGGADLNPATLKSAAFFSYGNSWTANPAIKLQGDVRIAAGIPLYFSSTANPDDADVQLDRFAPGTLRVLNFNTGLPGTLNASFDVTTTSSAFYKANGIQVVGARQAAIADPRGGSVVDAEARAALVDLLSKLRAHGLIAQ